MRELSFGFVLSAIAVSALLLFPLAGCRGGNASVDPVTGPPRSTDVGPPALDSAAMRQGGEASAATGDGGSVVASASDADSDSACTPTTCAAQETNCGSISDGCGSTLDCGTCSSPEACGVASPNVCGVPPGENQYFVNASSGSDTSGDGSDALPWKSIGKADAALTLGTMGTIVHVAPGTYEGPITTNTSGTATRRIVYVSDTRWAAKITTMNWAEKGSYVDVVGFDGTSTGSYGYGVEVWANDSVHILNNYLHDLNTSLTIGSIS